MKCIYERFISLLFKSSVKTYTTLKNHTSAKTRNTYYIQNSAQQTKPNNKLLHINTIHTRLPPKKWECTVFVMRGNKFAP